MTRDLFYIVVLTVNSARLLILSCFKKWRDRSRAMAQWVEVLTLQALWWSPQSCPPASTSVHAHMHTYHNNKFSSSEEIGSGNSITCLHHKLLSIMREEVRPGSALHCWLCCLSDQTLQGVWYSLGRLVVAFSFNCRVLHSLNLKP